MHSLWLFVFLLVLVAWHGVLLVAAQDATCGGSGTGAGSASGTCAVAPACDSIDGRLALLLLFLGAGTCGAGYYFYRSTLSPSAPYGRAGSSVASSDPMEEMMPTARPAAPPGKQAGSSRYDFVRAGVDF